jgi:hypothetical protein
MEVQYGVNRLSNQLRELNLTENDTVLLDLLSNSAFLGTSENGLPSRPERGDDSRCHVTGSLASASYLKKVLKTCQPLAAVVGNAGTVLVTPIPQYITGKCCDDPSHLENFDDQDFEESIIITGIDAPKFLLDMWGTEFGLSFVLIDPVMIANSSDLELRKKKNKRGDPALERARPRPLNPRRRQGSG